MRQLLGFLDEIDRPLGPIDQDQMQPVFVDPEAVDKAAQRIGPKERAHAGKGPAEMVDVMEGNDDSLVEAVIFGGE